MFGMEIKDKLATLCEQRRFDRYELLQFVEDVSRSTIDNWFSGKTRPTLAAALKLARGLRVPLEYLADDAIDDVPEESPGLTQDETMALDVYRDLRNHWGSKESLRAIMRLLDEAELQPGPPRVGPARDRTARDLAKDRAFQVAKRSGGKEGESENEGA